MGQNAINSLPQGAQRELRKMVEKELNSTSRSNSSASANNNANINKTKLPVSPEVVDEILSAMNNNGVKTIR